MQSSRGGSARRPGGAVADAGSRAGQRQQAGKLFDVAASLLLLSLLLLSLLLPPLLLPPAASACYCCCCGGGGGRRQVVPTWLCLLAMQNRVPLPQRAELAVHDLKHPRRRRQHPRAVQAGYEGGGLAGAAPLQVREVAHSVTRRQCRPCFPFKCLHLSNHRKPVDTGPWAALVKAPSIATSHPAQLSSPACGQPAWNLVLAHRPPPIASVAARFHAAPGRPHLVLHASIAVHTTPLLPCTVQRAARLF